MMNILSHRSHPASRRVGALTFFRAAMAAWRQRRALERLDTHARRDLGLSDHEIEIESARPIWDVPQNWRL